jgi:hypothetical protein
MNVQVKKTKKTPEFSDQARIYLAMESMFGDKVRAELRAFVDGDQVRFDVATVSDSGHVMFAVEVKQKQRTRWRKNWLVTRQGRIYSKAQIPIYMVCGSEEAAAFIGLLSALPSKQGVLWSEDWTQG